MAIAAGSSKGLQLVSAWSHAFAQWWLKELREALPSGWLGWADQTAKPALTLWRESAGVACRLAAGGRTIEKLLPPGDTRAVAGWLSEHGLEVEDVALGLAIPRDQFFVRDLIVPKAAVGALPRIAEQDVLRRTPFELTDIWHGTTGDDAGASDVCTFSHWILRKDRARAALADVGLSPDDIDFLAARGPGGEAIAAITLNSSRDEDPPWALRAVRLLGVAALVVTVLGLFVFEWFQSSVADSLEIALVEMRRGSQVGQEDPTGRLIAMKSSGGVLAIWDELSRVLPDDTFLTELRIADGKVVVAGLSGDAARLVRIVDRSPLFSGAFLDSAITPDATEHKERFRMGIRLRGLRDGRSLGEASGK